MDTKKEKKEKIYLNHFSILGWTLDRYGIVPDNPKSVDFEFITTVRPPAAVLEDAPLEESGAYFEKKKRKRSSIKLTERPSSLGTGGQVWPRSTLVLLEVLSNNEHLMKAHKHLEGASSEWEGKEGSGASYLKGKRMIELGSGTGLVSIVGTTLLGLAEVVITDLPELKAHIARNLEKNYVPYQITSGYTKTEEEKEEGGKVTITELDWRKPCDAYGKFDCIVCCDCVYEESCYVPLVSTITSLARGREDQAEGEKDFFPSIVVVGHEVRGLKEENFWEEFEKFFHCHHIAIPDEPTIRIAVCVKK